MRPFGSTQGQRPCVGPLAVSVWQGQGPERALPCHSHDDRRGQGPRKRAVGPLTGPCPRREFYKRPVTSGHQRAVGPLTGLMCWPLACDKDKGKWPKATCPCLVIRTMNERTSGQRPLDLEVNFMCEAKLGHMRTHDRAKGPVMWPNEA